MVYRQREGVDGEGGKEGTTTTRRRVLNSNLTWARPIQLTRRLFAPIAATTMSVDTIAIPSPADFHVHLRQDDMSKLVTPHVRKGGFRLAYVMVLSYLSVASC